MGGEPVLDLVEAPEEGSSTNEEPEADDALHVGHVEQMTRLLVQCLKARMVVDEVLLLMGHGGSPSQLKEATQRRNFTDCR